jgi:hypothetical protein
VSYAATLRREDLHHDGSTLESNEWTQRVATVVELVAGVREAIAAEPKRWSTQAGPSDRRALEYVLELALEAVREEIEIDCRRLALATGMGRSTAARALNRLILDGWLSLSEPGEGQRANRYRVLVRQVETDVTKDAEAKGGTQALPRPRSAATPPLTQREHHRTALRHRREAVSHDVFTHPGPGQLGLGRHVAVTAALLGTGMYKVQELVEMTGYSTRTIQHHLNVLQAHQLARYVSRPAPGAWRRTRTTFDSVANRIGAVGTRERRHRAYAIERETYAWWLAELDWLRTPGKRATRRGAARTVQGQAHLILPGLPSHATRPRYPRTPNGSPDHPTARIAVLDHRLVPTA